MGEAFQEEFLPQKSALGAGAAVGRGGGGFPRKRAGTDLAAPFNLALIPSNSDAALMAPDLHRDMLVLLADDSCLSGQQHPTHRPFKVKSLVNTAALTAPGGAQSLSQSC